ncbi:hypothetical protein BU25DRAFT_328988 [Macroventuria anomochaeta]|uniref:Uncharacterized protein n=1 Tax=Macroventuria anomochaeta TaxID=301207 RepID=A0ACB6SH46_9PLEO|nr:uncharacterized protein BU25DRAFT_328988 [Macroventuria anomochaeta]KAF2633605.1 hypothetical protein BU25DRAFT_328988 [Macroventuria anomochaeta]
MIWFSSFRQRPQGQTSKESRDQFDGCPFTIRQLNRTTYLIRENDRFGEKPHIYVKKHTETLPGGQTASVLIVNDTGCGTSAPDNTSKSREWNISTFIDHHLNATGDTLYLIILSHCHYDHILGLSPILRPAKALGEPQSSHVLIASSSHARSFLEPRANLREHSLCNSMGLHCPSYNTTIWTPHNQRLTISHPRLGLQMHLPVTTLHTPGHTPDGLSWYDEEERALYVGDSFYEAPAPILFPNEGNLSDWWRSVNTLISFVNENNKEKGVSRVTLSAGHVTVGVDAMDCLMDVREFVKRVLRDEVRFTKQPAKRGERFGFWSEEGGRFSLGAPLKVMEEGRAGIPGEEWRKSV